MHLNALDDPYLYLIRMNKVSDPAAYFQQTSAIQTSNIKNKEQLIETVNLLFKKFKDCKIAVVTLADMSVRDVGPIFERINSSTSSGARLTIVDLMRAATWSQKFDLFNIIDEVLKSFETKNFEKIERMALLRSISAAAGGEFQADSIDTLRDRKPDELKAANNAVKKSYSLAIDFLASDIGVPGEGALPYSNQIVVPSEVFRRLPNPNPEQRREISKWFWRTTATNYFAGWNTTMMVDDLKRARDFSGGVLERMREGFDSIGVKTWSSRVFRSNSAYSKPLALILSQASPRDLLTGQKLDIGQALAAANYKEFHHVCPVAFLQGDRRKSAANSLSNIVYLTSLSNKIVSSQPLKFFDRSQREPWSGVQ